MRVYLLIMLVAAATTFLLAGLVRRIGVATGAMTEVRDRDVHVAPTPRLGGVAMIVGLATALLAASQFPLTERLFGTSTDARALLSGGLVICLVGVADDIWGLDALTKFAGQVLAAAVMVVQGVQLYWLPWDGGTLSLTSAQGTLLTVLVVVFTINAVNFVDGLDGLAAGVVGIGACAFFAYAYLLAVEYGLQRATAPALIAAILVGLCVGFLPHNFSPARVFMGDSGAMLLGLLFAASSITLTGYVDPTAVRIGALAALLPLILPVAVLAIPILDLLLAVVRRTWAGRSPFHPDKQHLHHRMLSMGHSQRRAVLLMWAWSATIAFGVVLVSLVDGWVVRASVAAALVLVTALTLVLPRLERRSRRPIQASP